MLNETKLGTALKNDGRSYREIGFCAGVSPSYLSRIVKGERVPTRQMILKLSKVLKVEPQKLVES